jgi:hypothetical protein
VHEPPVGVGAHHVGHIDEFVLVRMPVTLARAIARRQAHDINPKMSKPAGVARPSPHAFGTGRVMAKDSQSLCASARFAMSVLGMALDPVGGYATQTFGTATFWNKCGEATALWNRPRVSP